MILQVHQHDARVVPAAPFAIHILLHQLLFNDPIHLVAELHGILFQAIEHPGPPTHHICFHGILFGGPQIFHRPLKIDPLDLDRGHFTPVFQLDFFLECGVPRDLPDSLHRIVEFNPIDRKAVLDHRQYERRGADLQVGGHFRHVRITHDDMQPPILFGVGMRLVAGVDNAARGSR